MGILLRLALLMTICCHLPAKAQQTDSLYLKAAIEKLEHSRDYTLLVASSMPSELYFYRPTADEMSFSEQLVHLAGNMGWLCTSYLGGKNNPVTEVDNKAVKKEEVIAILHKTYAYALNTLRQFNTNQLADTVSFFAGPLNKLQIIQLVSDHQTHHRAQLLVYLRLNGIKPPAYSGW